MSIRSRWTAPLRIALGIEYDGTDFLGWQRLTHGNAVQASVEAALSFVADAAVNVTCAGRTDAGVHARCQVVHFDTEAQRAQLGARCEFAPAAQHCGALGMQCRRQIPCALQCYGAALPLPDSQSA